MEYDKDEWFDVCRILRPETSREQFEADWAEFQRLKAEHLAKASIQ